MCGQVSVEKFIGVLHGHSNPLHDEPDGKKNRKENCITNYLHYLV